MNKVALVTGGLKGIGEAISLQYIKDGFIVYVNYRQSEKNEELIKSKEKIDNLHYLKGDISKEDDVKRMIDFIKEKEGHLDVLVNNAGIINDKLILRMSLEDFEKVNQINLTGTFLMMKYASKVMMKQKSGKIISLSSYVGIHGNSGQVNYAASKAGIIGMSKSLAKELGRKNIQVNVIAPGFIETDMTKSLNEDVKKLMLNSIALARFGKVQNIAYLASFLASKKSDYITGQVFSVDGGLGI